MHPVLKDLVTALLPKAVLRPVLQRRFLASRRWGNRNWGVFDSFAAARHWAAQQGEQPRYTLDHAAWLKARSGLMAHDYPMLFWLGRILDGKRMRVVDLGGSVGVSYLAYRNVLPFDNQLQWQVCELPETVEQGIKIAQEHAAPQLSFTSDLKAMDGSDVLFTAGAIQYMETPLPNLLRELATPPKHVLINKLPLTQRGGFVTLEHTGQAMAPNAIANDGEFVQAMIDFGYRLVDRWLCLEHVTNIPLHPELSLPCFHGFYFVRDGVAAPPASPASPPDR